MNVTNIQQELEEVEDWLAELRKEKAPIIVEGLKDIASLESLGVSGNIISFNKGESVVVFCERISRSNRRVIILTDWDRKGGHLARLMSEAFQANGVEFDLEYRARIAILCKKETKDVEGLYSHYRRLKDKAVEQPRTTF